MQLLTLLGGPKTRGCQGTANVGADPPPPWLGLHAQGYEMRRGHEAQAAEASAWKSGVNVWRSRRVQEPTE